MSVSTVYDVKLVYSMADRNATTGQNAIADSARRAQSATDGLMGSLRSVGAILLGGAGMMAGKKAFIDFNSEVEQSKISIAAVSRMFSPGMTFDAAMVSAEETFGRYQQAAIQSTSTTQDFLKMHQMLVPSFSAAGIAQQKLEAIVKKSTVAADILLPGQADASGMFARDLQSMLRGNVTVRDQAASLVIKAMGMDNETFNAKARKDVNFAVGVIEKGLDKLTSGGALSALEGSYKGVASTFEDMTQILAGSAGKPLFAAITAEVQSWNKWLVANKDQVKAISREVGATLVTGFKSVKDSASWLVENKDTLIAIATAYAAIKGVSFVAGTVSSIGAALTVASTGLLELGMVLTGVAGPIVAVVALAAAAWKFKSWVDDNVGRTKDADRAGTMGAWQSIVKSKERDSHVGTAYDVGKGTAAERAYLVIKGAGAVDKYGRVDSEKWLERGKELSGDHPEAGATMEVLARYAKAFEFNRGFGPEYGPERESPKAKSLKGADVKVTIQRVEVASSDPDRFVMDLVDVADRALNRPTQGH